MFGEGLQPDRTVQYKLNAQSLRLFGLHRDVNDAHRAGANRLQNKTNHGKCEGPRCLDKDFNHKLKKLTRAHLVEHAWTW